MFILKQLSSFGAYQAVFQLTALVGKQIPLKRGVYVEPQDGMSYMRLGGTTFTTGAMMVHQSPINSISGKLGVEIGRTIGAGNPLVVH